MVEKEPLNHLLAIMESIEFLKEIEAKAEKWADIAAPIFGDSTKKFVSAQGFGTGFIASVGDGLFFITAHHVVNDFKKYSTKVTNVQDVGFDLNKLTFHGAENIDICYASLAKEDLLELGKLSVKHFPLDRDWSEWTPRDIFVVIGYPASRNVLKLQFNSMDRNCFNLFTKQSPRHSKKTKVPDHIALDYNPKAVFLNDGSKLQAPELWGLSGGPCFQLMVKGTASNLTLSFRLRGVVSEFQAQERLIVVSPIEAIYRTAYGSRSIG